jgi:hypothetical protein
MTCLAVWVTSMDRKANVIALEFAVSCERQPSFRARNRWWEKRIAAFGAEEMLLVICPSAKLGIIERDETLIDDSGLAMITPRRKFLK